MPFPQEKLDPGATSQTRGMACSATIFLPSLEAGDPGRGETRLLSGVKAPKLSLDLLIPGREAKTGVQHTPSFTANCSLHFDLSLFLVHSDSVTKQDSRRQSPSLPNLPMVHPETPVNTGVKT